MNRFTRFQKIIIGCITFFVLLGFVMKGMQSKGGMSDLGYDAFSLLRYGMFEYPIHSIQNWTNDYADLWKAKEENDSLRYQLSQQTLYEAQLIDAQRQIAELKEHLEMKEDQKQYQMVAANVISRDADAWNNHFTIDLGSYNGMENDMIVLSSKGVVGKISEVSKFTSKVKLLTSEDRQNNVAVKILLSDKASSEGILQSYDVNRGAFVIHVFDGNNDIKEDMQVVTSGKGGVYPSGLLIGTVNTIEELSNSIGKTIYVKPSADFQNFDFVQVIRGAK
ncbi:MAG: rod shape-determining protein MreC [Erysipelotrichaceae bacterium]|nr:rod shape-determining protein MreC [Erysipelotrichaceae bacterium]MCI9524943.1 rod shape-determining protein MreC [Erysipelotrichaceae bacterium]